MKNYQAILLAAILLMVGTNFTEAQTFKEQLAAKIEAARKKLAGESTEGGGTSVANMPTEGQLEIAEKWESGKYTYYDADGRMMRKQGTSYIRFIREDGVLTHIRLGEEGGYEMEQGKYNAYSYGGSEFVCAFVKNNINCIYVTDEMIVFYACDGDYNVDYIIGSMKSKKSTPELIKEIQAYRDYGNNKIDTDRENLEKDEIEHRLAFSLENKEVTKIVPVFPNGVPTSIRDDEKIEVGFEITLADGTQLKTSNIGGDAYIEDLEDKTINARISGVGTTYMPGLYGANPKTNSFIQSKMYDVSKDYLVITIKPKYKGNASCEIKLPIEYGTKATYTCSGNSGGDNSSYGGSGGDAGDGGTVVVKITTTTHSETGETLYYCQATGCSEQYFKLKIGAKFFVSASGGRGGKGGPGRDVNGNGGYAAPTNGGPAGDGGNGGSVTYLIDPSAKDIEVGYNVDGGNGGSGGIHGTCFSCSYGQDANDGPWGNGGSAGYGSKKIQAVSF